MIISIKTGNAAFADGNKAHELARILRDAAARLEREGTPEPGQPIKLRDLNGNTVGTIRGN